MLHIIFLLRFCYVVIGIFLFLFFMVFAFVFPHFAMVFEVPAPFGIALFYLLGTALHFRGLVKICCPSFLRGSKVSSFDAIKSDAKKKLYAFIEVHYDQMLVFREVIEIPVWTLQAYEMTLEVPDTTFVLLYTFILALDCIVTPIIMKTIRNDDFRAHLTELCDVFYDLMLGIVLPALPALHHIGLLQSYGMLNFL